MTSWPAGTMTARTSRLTTKGSFSCRRMGLFGGYGRRLVFTERRVERVPAEARALDSYGKLAHARERGELAERGVGGRVVAREQRVHLAEELAHGRAVASLDGLRHERRGGGRDRATLALEADVLDALAVEAHGERELVTAQRVVAFRAAVGVVDPAEIARMAVVIEDHVAIELLEIHQWNTWRARSSALTSAPTSPSVL